MQSVFRIVNTLKGGEPLKKDKGLYTLQFVDYMAAEDSEEPIEIVANSIELTVGQILRDTMNMSEQRDREAFIVTEDTTTDEARYIEFIREICTGISKDALEYCYSLYDDFYNLGKSREAYVPTMNVKMELDCTDDGYLQEYFYIESFEDMLVYDFYSAVKGRFAVKKCQLCGTYFITQNRTDELYCSSACRNTISRQRSRIHHRLDDENELLKRRIASRLQQRTKVSNLTLREERMQVHQQFLYDVKQWKKKIKSGQSSQENYKLWLQAQDIKYATMIERREPLPAEVRPTKVLKSAEVKIDEGLAAKLSNLANPVIEEPNFEKLKHGEMQESENFVSDFETNLKADLEEDVAAFNEQLSKYLPKESYNADKTDYSQFEEQGIREDIKAKILNKSESKRNTMQDILFPDLERYGNIDRETEAKLKDEEMDFGTFIKQTYAATHGVEEPITAANGDSISENRIVGELRPTNIRQSKFPLFESVLAAAEREEQEAVAETWKPRQAGSEDIPKEALKADFSKGESPREINSAEGSFTLLTVGDMKARLNQQKATLKAQGLEELMGLLEDEDN